MALNAKLGFGPQYESPEVERDGPPVGVKSKPRVKTLPQGVTLRTIRMGTRELRCYIANGKYLVNIEYVDDDGGVIEVDRELLDQDDLRAKLGAAITL